MNRTYHWAASIGRSDIAALGGLRGFSGVEVSVQPDAVWLRGYHDDALAQQLKAIPGLKRYEASDSKWREVHSLIPSVHLPDGEWRPVKEVLGVSLPPAASPAQSNRKVPLMMERGGPERAPSALLAELTAWVQFATEAPGARLASLRFAAEESGKMLVLGKPLPSLPGTQLIDHEGILVACGWKWTPDVNPRVLRQLFRLEGTDVCLLSNEGTQQVIKAEQFVPASRSAARKTLAAHRDD